MFGLSPNELIYLRLIIALRFGLSLGYYLKIKILYLATFKSWHSFFESPTFMFKSAAEAVDRRRQLLLYNIQLLERDPIGFERLKGSLIGCSELELWPLGGAYR